MKFIIKDKFTFYFIRGIFIVGVVLYHSLYDIQFFANFNINVLDYPLLFLQRVVAGGLLVLFGMTCAIIGFNKIAIIKRFLKLAAISIVISIGSYLIDRDNFIYFGILHLMAISSLICLLFLKLNSKIVLLSTLFILIYGSIYPTESSRPSFDYFSFFPWFGCVVLGIYLQKINILKNIFIQENLVTNILAKIGKHSMLIYLIHQPILLLIFKIAGVL